MNYVIEIKGIRSLNWNGRAITVGYAGGNIPKIPANILLVKNLSLHGVYWGAHAKYDPKLFYESVSKVVQWWVQGAITPHISSRHSIEHINEAFKQVDSRNSTGKVVIEFNK